MIVPSQQREISMDVPGSSVNVAQAGIVSDAVAGLAGTAADVSLKLMDHLKTEEARNAVDKTSSQNILDMQDKYASMQLSAPDGLMRNPDGSNVKDEKGGSVSLGQAYQGWLNEHYKKSQLSLPSKLAQELYTEKMNPIFTSSIAKAQADERVLRATSYNSVTGEIGANTGNFLTASPNLDVLYTHSNSQGQRINFGVGVHYDATEGAKKYTHENELASKSYFEGRFGQVLDNSKGDRTGSAKELLSELLGIPQNPETIKRNNARQKSGLKTAPEMLSANERASMIAQAARMANTSKDMDSREYHQSMATFKAMAGSPDRRYKVTPQQVAEVQRPYLRSGAILPQQIISDNAEVVVNDRVRKLDIGDRAYLPEDQLEATRLQGRNEVANSVMTAAMYNPELQNHPLWKDAAAGAVNAYDEKSKAHDKQLVLDRNKDFTGLIISRSDSLQAAMSKVEFGNPDSVIQNAKLLRSVRDQVNIKYEIANPYDDQYRNFLSDKAAKTLVQTLTENSNTKAGVDQNTKLISVYQQVYGKDFYPLMTRLIKDHNLPERFNDAGSSEDPLVAKDIMASIMGNGDAIGIYIQQGGSQGELNTAYNTFAAKWVAAALNLNSGNPESDRKIKNAGYTVQSKAASIRNQSNGATSINDAMKSAVTAIYGKNRYFFETNGMGVSGSLKVQHVMPKMVNGRAYHEEDIIHMKTWANENMTAEALQKYGITPPPSARVGGIKYDPKRFFEFAAKEGGWVQTPDFSGWTYKHWIHDEKDSIRTQYVQAFTTDSSGRIKPLFIPNEKVLQTPVSDNRTKMYDPRTWFGDEHGPLPQPGPEKKAAPIEKKPPAAKGSKF